MTIKQTIGAVLLGTALAAGSAAAEEVKEVPTQGSVETMVGYKGAVTDLKTTTDLGAGFGLFTRNFGTLSYTLGQEGAEASDFGLADLTYNLGPNGDIVLEGQYSISGGFFSPRVGLQAYGGAGPVSVYGLATVAPGDVPVELIGIAGVDAPLGERAKFHLGVEALIDLGLDGPAFAQQKARLGIGDDHFEAGAGVDILEVPGEKLGLNVGAYVKGSW
ncbi:MAG: hypothetical protein ABIG93_00375 [archaeon]|nr:hypothetical protein [Nanoarchaeota archaeon]